MHSFVPDRRTVHAWPFLESMRNMTSSAYEYNYSFSTGGVDNSENMEISLA